VNYVYNVQRPGLGDVTSAITDAAVASMKPAIREIMVNDVLPMLGVFMLTGAVAASFIGTWFGVRAARVHGGIRRNPVSRVHVLSRLPRRRTA
jgi:hypothetical protein